MAFTDDVSDESCSMAKRSVSVPMISLFCCPLRSSTITSSVVISIIFPFIRISLRTSGIPVYEYSITMSPDLKLGRKSSPCCGICSFIISNPLSGELRLFSVMVNPNNMFPASIFSGRGVCHRLANPLEGSFLPPVLASNCSLEMKVKKRRKYAFSVGVQRFSVLITSCS